MAVVTRFGDIGSRVAAFAIADLLKRAIPLMPLEKFAQSFVIPRNSTTVAKWRRYEPLPPTTTPLVEGITPAGYVPTVTDVTATLYQYGAWIGHSDVIMDVADDPVLEQFKQILAEQCAQSLELVRINALLAGTNVFYANGTARSAVNTAPTETFFRKIVRQLKRYNAPVIARITKSTPSYATAPTEAAYVAFIHPDLVPAIRALTGFVHVKNYGTATPYEGEIGTFEDLRFVVTTLLQPYQNAGGTKGSMIGAGANADVYPIIIMGRDAWGSVVLRGYTTGSSRNSDGMGVAPIDLIVKNPASGGAENPLNQRGSVGWKTMMTAQILQDAWMVRAEVAVTEL